MLKMRVATLASLMLLNTYATASSLANNATVVVHPQHRAEAMSELVHIPERFATNEAVNLSTSNAGSWIVLGDASIWKLRVESPEATTMGFNASGSLGRAVLKVLDSDGEEVQTLTEANRFANQFFSRLIPGESFELRLEVPTEHVDSVSFRLTSLQVGFRAPFSASGSVFQSKASETEPGSCRVNYECYANIDTDPNSEATVMLIYNNGAGCTGTLVNSSDSDGVWRVLTARHCVTDASLSAGQDLAFQIVFNGTRTCGSDWEYPVFTDPTTFGARLLAHDGERNESGAVLGGDALLFEITGTIPSGIVATFAGYDATGAIPAPGSYGIHHASSFNQQYVQYGTVVAYDEPAPLSQNYWRINGESNHLVGTTAAGGSGSGLFDTGNRIRGMLHGGAPVSQNSDCSLDTFYARMDHFWEGDGTAAGSAKFHLSDATQITRTSDPYSPAIPAAPLATVELQSSKNQNVTPGEGVRLEWSSQNTVGSCVASGEWSGDKTLNGYQTVYAQDFAGDYDYTLTCHNADGVNASDSITLNVTQPSPAPTTSPQPTPTPAAVQPTPQPTSLPSRPPSNDPNDNGGSGSLSWVWLIFLSGCLARQHRMCSPVNQPTSGRFKHGLARRTAFQTLNPLKEKKI